MAHVLCEVELVVGLDREGAHCVGVQNEALLGHIHYVFEGVLRVGVRCAVVEHFLGGTLQENELF